MRAAFYIYKTLNQDKQRETEIAEAFKQGFERCGGSVDFIPAKNFCGAERSYDIVCAVGLRAHVRKVMKAYRSYGTNVVVFDKGLVRVANKSVYNRVCLNTGVPNEYMMRVPRPSDRWEKLNIRLLPLRERTKLGPIVYANNSQKVHDFWHLGDERAFTVAMIDEIKKRAGGRPVVFRPKPGLYGPKEGREDGGYFSGDALPGIRISSPLETIEDALWGAHVLITQTSNCSINAIMAGIPAICTGPCAANPVSSKSLDLISNPPFPSYDDRKQWLYNLAYCQWSDEEIQSGVWWDFFRHELEALS